MDSKQLEILRELKGKLESWRKNNKNNTKDLPDVLLRQIFKIKKDIKLWKICKFLGLSAIVLKKQFSFKGLKEDKLKSLSNPVRPIEMINVHLPSQSQIQSQVPTLTITMPSGGTLKFEGYSIADLSRLDLIRFGLNGGTSCSI